MFDQWGFQCESTLATRTPFSKDMHHGNGDKLTVRLNTQNEWGYSLTCGRFYTTPQNKCLFYCYASDVQCRRYFLISKQIARKGHTLFFCFIVFTPHQIFFLCCFELQQLFFLSFFLSRSQIFRDFYHGISKVSFCFFSYKSRSWTPEIFLKIPTRSRILDSDEIWRIFN